MRALVTGGEGFIGSQLVRYLKEKEFEPIIFDVTQGQDVTRYKDIRTALQCHRPEFIYHTAAQGLLIPGEKDPYNDVDVNVKGMINILRAIKELELDPVLLYTSSGAVYGNSELPHRENCLCRPMSNYGISKLAAELYLQKEVATWGLNAKIVRFSSVYGHGRKAGPVNLFIDQARKGGPITVHGSGSQTRDLVSIEDVIPGLILVAERGKRGEVYNIGLGEEHSVAEVAYLVKKNFRSVKISFISFQGSPFDLPRSWFDISKAKGLGYKPRIDLDHGIKIAVYEAERRDS